MAKKTRTLRSRYFPSKLQLIVEDSADVPDLSRSQEALLLTLGGLGWRLLRARKRAGTAKQAADAARDKILDRLPTSLVGVEVRRKRGVSVTAISPLMTEVLEIESFIDYLGVHASDIISGVKLPLDELLSRANYSRFIRALLDEFGEDFADQVGVVYRKGDMLELIQAGKLPEPPEGMFKQVPSESRRVIVSLLDPQASRAARGSIVDESRGNLAVSEGATSRNASN